jgi:hypothetical protein
MKSVEQVTPWTMTAVHHVSTNDWSSRTKVDYLDLQSAYEKRPLQQLVRSSAMWIFDTTQKRQNAKTRNGQ